MGRLWFLGSILLVLAAGCGSGETNELSPDTRDGAGADVETVLDSLGTGADARADIPTGPPPDRDEDGVPDELDRFPEDPCEAFDMDDDGVGDIADPDRDGDGVDDRWERRVGTDPNDPADTPSEDDADEDGVPDYRDRFPNDADRAEDLDGDGLGDAEDPDDDNDGVPDEDELAAGTDPRELVPPNRCALSHGWGWYAGDLHQHTNYSDDAREQGGDDIGPWVDINNYYSDPRFLAAHPEYAGRGLDFVSLTDHRTVAGALDPDFHSDDILLIAGEEIGGPGHANGHGLRAFVGHGSRGGENYAERIVDSVAQVHWYGGVFQANHICSPGTPWTTSMGNMDAVEIWNTPWSVERPITIEELDSAAPSRGPENPWIRPAIERVQTNANAQALAIWEMMLSSGRRIAAVGGSDRHMMFAPATPTTRVMARNLSEPDILDGIRAGRTSMSRNPAAVKLEVLAWTGDAVEAPEDAAIPGDAVAPDADAPVQLEVRLDRAPGGIVQVVAGAVDSDAEPTQGAVLATHPVPPDEPGDYTWRTEITPPAPGWFYVRVIEPIDTSAYTEATAAKLDTAIASVSAGLDDPLDLALVLLPVVGGVDLIAADPCTEDDWAKGGDLPAECFLVDEAWLYSYLFPDVVDRILNYWKGEAPDGEWCLGALASAIYVD